MRPEHPERLQASVGWRVAVLPEARHALARGRHGRILAVSPAGVARLLLDGLGPEQPRTVEVHCSQLRAETTGGPR